MAIEVKTSAIGISDTLKAIDDLADGRDGKKWKRQAFLKSGREAFQHAISKAKANAPVGKTGLTRRSISSSLGTYNAKPKGKARGGVTASTRNEYTIYSRLSAGFEQTKKRDRKGNAYRYPFMNEVGVPPKPYVRISKKGNLHTVTRKAARNPLLFQQRALQQTSGKVIGTFNRKLGFYLNLFTKSTYQSLQAAHSNFIKTGGQGSKWK
ncbi:conserved hypothetical protein [Vibrio chagasii]|nr:conserved hypothetical protein [Vibrio chagasii]